MRNKANRLEELFLRLVEGRDVGKRPGEGRVGVRRLRDERLVDIEARRATSAAITRCRAHAARAPQGRVLRRSCCASSSRIIRIWGQTILPPVILVALYFVIFGNLIGRRIGLMGGFDYKQYIAPGLIMMAVITNAYGNVVSSFFSAKINRHLEEMLVAPMSNVTIVLGHMAGGIVRGLFVGLAVTAVALVFTPLPFSPP